MIDAIDLLADFAYGALALLVALLVIYFAVKLLGKLAKFVITLAVIGLVLWFVLSDHSILRPVMDLGGTAKDALGDKIPSLPLNFLH